MQDIGGITTDLVDEPQTFVLSSVQMQCWSRHSYVMKANNEADKVAWVAAISAQMKANASVEQPSQQAIEYKGKHILE